MAIQNGLYTNFVFQNLEKPENDLYRYLTVTMCPNWEYSQKLEIGDEGFLEYETANAGDSYLDKEGKQQFYKYTALYFMKFLKENINMSKKEFKF